jgi:hypothetical protein
MLRYSWGRTWVAAAVILGLSACETRSISNSGYQADRWGAGNAFYHGELSAYDVLGLDPLRGASDEEIAKALTAKQPISVKKGSAVLLVQSGADFPDAAMVNEMERYYTVSSFTGVPARPQGATSGQPPVPYAQLFRLAAAKGGFETVVVYWGILESASESMASKSLSWLPVIGGVIPDQNQQMRIRLMVAVIDVRTGQWESFTTAPIEHEAISNEHHRAASDQEQVELLKGQAYKAAADALAARYGR